jgi:malate dehydrogenase (oxaloacetate-decarboxylating)(NADP+)
MDDDQLKQRALDYHRYPVPGKIAVTPTKELVNQRDLALAYTPGVAVACDAIKADPAQASELTARGNLIAVITNGTAVLGLGSIGPLAAKPVMEGKGVLFKKFAGIDVFDLEIDERDPERLVDIIAALEPTFGGINLEDIKAPECFIVERTLRALDTRLSRHQHGGHYCRCRRTQWVESRRQIGAIRWLFRGGCAGCLDLLVSMGLPIENVWVMISLVCLRRAHGRNGSV